MEVSVSGEWPRAPQAPSSPPPGERQGAARSSLASRGTFRQGPGVSMGICGPWAGWLDTVTGGRPHSCSH